MEIIRVCEIPFNPITQREHGKKVYILMDVNWFREKCWLVQKYAGEDFLGRPCLTHQQVSWDGIDELIEGLQIKKDTENSRENSTGTDRQGPVLKTHDIELDNSRYITKRYFPYLRGKWSHGNKFVRDIPSQNLDEYPEYLI